jgi:chorismate synthase
VLMRSLMIGLFVSVGALLVAAGAMVRHVMRQRQERVDATGNVEAVLEIEAESQRKAEELENRQ